MILKDRIKALVWLGKQLEHFSDSLQAAIRQTHIHNAWFVPENIEKSIRSIHSAFLEEEALEKWVKHYHLSSQNDPKTVALILAGNIPLVGFHDVLCVFVAGHRAAIKLSDKDKFIFPHLVEIMAQKFPAVKDYFHFIQRLSDFDAVIATGSNNSARYFESYFGTKPNIIRKNRNAVAILYGDESPEQLAALADDVFSYFGLGCRNVSKLYVPKDYDFDPLLTAFHEHKELVLHNKYKNNFDYNYTLLILNKVSYKANGCILLTEDTSLQSRIASLHYEYFEDLEKLSKELDGRASEIQCIVSKQAIENKQTIAPGQAQQPGLMDYADGVDTMQFLLGL